MSSIDQVIARSRQPGAFTERKRFTVARSNAIRKMRQFALADPHYYVLELIQSAVSNGASYLDISAQNKHCTVSYIGGGYSEEQLSQLFDFLFASKSDMAYSDLRQLALGVNALMLMEPDEIVIESGDGTLEGTTRIVIKGTQDFVDVGTPDRPLRGTFVRASGLKRSKIRGKSRLEKTDYGPPETRAIEERCLCAPIPILVNDNAPFGYSTLRTPSIYGYTKVVSFDEGDLYGTIGLRSREPQFKLLTYGAWIQTVERSLIPGEGIGGIVVFDGLNKTADHAAIVRDERYEELWIRLMPYARQLISGQAGETFNIQTLSGSKLSVRELREVLRDSGKAVAVSLLLDQNSEEARRALRIGQLLDAPVLKVAPSERDVLRFLGGKGFKLVVPDVSSLRDLQFYEQPPIEEPPRPWVIGAVDVSEVTVAEVLKWIWREEAGDSDFDPFDPYVLAPRLGGRVAKLASREEARGLSAGGVTEPERFEVVPGLNAIGTITSRIYTPLEVVTGCDEILIRVVSSQRLLWAGTIPSSFPGHVMVIELDDVIPRHLEHAEGDPRGFDLARALARVMVRHAERDFERATNRALEGILADQIDPGTGLAQMILAAIGRDSILRLRRVDEALDVGITMLERRPIDLLELEVLQTVSGERRSIRSVVASMNRNHGLVYGVIPEVNAFLKGLDTTDVLALTEAEEQLLVSIIGPAAYVRIDARDFLASVTTPALAHVRDIALGLKEYGKTSPMLLEHAQPETWDDETRAYIERALVAQLDALWRDSESGEVHENRRQALRHVQYYLVEVLARGGDPGELLDAPMFVDLRGRRCSFEDVKEMFHEHGGLFIADGRAVDALSITHEGNTNDVARGLAMNPFLAHLFERVTRVQATFDFDLHQTEVVSTQASPEELYLVSKNISSDGWVSPGISGVIGIPREELDDFAIAVIDARGEFVQPLRGVAHQFGLVGVLRSQSGVLPTEQEIYKIAQALISELLVELVELPAGSSEWSRAVRALFNFAEHHLLLMAHTDGSVGVRVSSPLAQVVLDLPLFDTTFGMPVSAQRLLREVCVNVDLAHDHGALSPRTELAELPAVLAGWCERWFHANAITRLPTNHDGEKPETSRAPAGAQVTPLEATIEHWISTLRPDPRELSVVKVVDFSNARAELVEFDERTRAAVELRGGSKQPEAFSYIEHEGGNLLFVNAAHWLTASFVREGARDVQGLSWLLLAAYAYINEVLEAVTNEHEMMFQRELIGALERGDVSFVQPRA